MKNSKNYLVELRNATIGWFVMSIILLVSLWFSYDTFTQLGKKLEEHNQKKIQTIENIQTLGIISDQKIAETAIDEVRIKTILNIVPGIKNTIGTGTTEETKNLEIIKKITKKDKSEQDYISWLKNSWDAQSKDNLDKLQDDIAQIIPIFSGVSGITGTENTKHITGKITLKSLIDFIQNDIAQKYHLGHAMGSIGIEGVQFNQGGSEIGAYNIPLKFDNVKNKDVINLLDFLARTGGVKLQKMKNDQFSIQHIYPRVDKKISQSEETVSQLKNPLITVQSFSVSPTQRDDPLLTEEEQEWNISITLTFYIRGVSGDHLMRMDQALGRSLGDTQPGELITLANKILDACRKQISCTDENRISDMITLLNSAKNTYKSILGSDKSSTPIARVKRRSDLMTTVSSIEKKLKQIEEARKDNL